MINSDNIRRIWSESDHETRKEIMDWFGAESLQATSDLMEFPREWIDFVRLCAFDGLSFAHRLPWYVRLLNRVSRLIGFRS